VKNKTAARREGRQAEEVEGGGGGAEKVMK
jgi:hypothetical protein